MAYALVFASGVATGLVIRFWGQKPLEARLLVQNTFLRAQLTALLSRRTGVRLSPARRLWIALLSRWVDLRDSLYIVQPATLVRWHRQLYRLAWRWRSRKKCGRPPVPPEVVVLIREMGRDNPCWGEERIADELSLKLGIEVSPRSVRRYLPRSRPRPGAGGPGWNELLRLHAGTVLAADFFTMPTLNAFRSPSYVFVLMDVTTRRLLHIHVTSNPTTDWVLQQLREALPHLHPYRFLIHDRDSIFSRAFRAALAGFHLHSLQTPPKTPTANAFCERLIGSIRRECLDYAIPLNEGHLRRILREWARHYNEGRPHSSLGPGLPDPRSFEPPPPSSGRHDLPAGHRVRSSAIVGGLHHEYRLEKRAA